MNDTHRTILAALVSVLLHIAGIAALHYRYVPPPPPPEPEAEPIVLNLQPEPPPPPEEVPPRQLVDVAEPAPQPMQPTDRIAETHAESMDLAALPAPTQGPQLELDDFDALPQSTAPAAPPEPPSPPPPPKEQAKELPEAEEAEQLLDAMDIPLETLSDRADETDDPDTVNERKERVPEDYIRIARAMPSPAKRPSPGRSRERSAVSKQGMTNFDAIQNEIAPYLKQVREKVELRWNEMLYTRYSGTTPTQAVVDCAISPQGELISVVVVEPVGDRLYGALCREAIRRAGPFGAFTFEVPDIYKDKNLEIRWTFNFL